MDTSAMLAGGAAGLIGLLIGLAIGVVIGALLIMLGSKLVMGSAAKFGSACLAALASSIAGFVIGLVIGFAIGALAPAMASIAPIVSLVAGILVTPLIYSAVVKTNDGRSPSYVQGLLIYLVQAIIVLAIGAVLVFALRIPIPGVTA